MHPVEGHTLICKLVGAEVLEEVVDLMFVTKVHLLQLHAVWLRGGIFRVRSHLSSVLVMHELGTGDGSVNPLRRAIATVRCTSRLGRFLGIVVLALLLVWVVLCPTTTASSCGAGSSRSSGAMSGSSTARSGAWAFATAAASNATAVDIDRWGRRVDVACACEVPPKDMLLWFPRPPSLRHSVDIIRIFGDRMSCSEGRWNGFFTFRHRGRLLTNP